MGRKAREAMATARASLEARYTRDIGPSTPPCHVCGAPSNGTVSVFAVGSWNVCQPLGCGITAVGERNFHVATYAPHPTGRYRGK